MSRSVLGLDRLVAVVVALVLVVVGVATAAWGGGWLVQVWSTAPATIQLKNAENVVGMSWWPLASGALGVVLLVLAVWWLVAHLPRNGVDALALTGSRSGARLTIDPSGAASTAADVLEDVPGIRSASSRVLRERGKVVIAVKATVEPDADLPAVTRAVDAVSGDLQQVLGRDDVLARVQLAVARRGRSAARVH